MRPKTKASPTGDPRKALATEASLLTYCAGEYRALLGATWTGETRRNVLGGDRDDVADDDSLADALDDLRTAALKVARLAPAAPLVIALTERIIATEPIWNWRLPAAPAKRQAIVRNVSTFYTRRLTNHELAIVSVLCGCRPSRNVTDTVDDVVKREADAMRRVRERARTTRRP